VDGYKTSGSSPGLGRKPLNPPQTSVPLKTQPNVDFRLENHGSIFLLRPITLPAFEWVEQHIGRDSGWQPYFPNIVIEHRYIADIVAGIQNDELVVLA
jgi:hypothetical protein